MPISEHLDSFAGYKVVDFDPREGITKTEGILYRLRHEPEAKPVQKAVQGILGGWFGKKAPPPPPTATASPLDALLADPKAGELQGIVYGAWFEDFDPTMTSEKVVVNLVAAANRLPKLRALFIGDMTFEECEISWIKQSDLTPLIWAYPQLEHFGARGAEDLKIGPINHDRLRTLVIQSGGLPPATLKEVLESELPALEHLELWLGEENYGGDVKVGDLEPLLSGKLFPNLRYLGLRDSEIADEIAAALVNAPIMQRILTLDLSMGNLSNEGAKALLANPALKRLRKLDVHHHFMTPEVMKQLRLSGPEVDVSDVQEPEKYSGEGHRFIEVSE